MLYFWFFILALLEFPVHAEELGPSVPTLIADAETLFYKVGEPDHYDRVQKILDEIKKLNRKEPYAYWASARVAFFVKENFYIPGTGVRPNDLDKKKLELADLCHDNAQKCIAIDPRNPECHLMKGSCYAMQASTWGAGLKSMNICNPMNEEWDKAMNLPSKFSHPGNVTTKQLAQILRAILFRVMPDSWWFRFLAGIRGNKKKAFTWMKEAVVGDTMVREPLIVLERAATTICYGRKENLPALVKEGLDWLKNGLSLPTRYAMDDFDKRNMQILIDKPQEACNYRRERFEDLSEDAISKKVK